MNSSSSTKNFFKIDLLISQKLDCNTDPNIYDDNFVSISDILSVLDELKELKLLDYSFIGEKLQIRFDKEDKKRKYYLGLKYIHCDHKNPIEDQIKSKTDEVDSLYFFDEKGVIITSDHLDDNLCLRSNLEVIASKMAEMKEWIVKI